MSIRDLIPARNPQVPVTRGANPIVAFQDEVNQLFNAFFGELTLPSWDRQRMSDLAISPAVDVTENENTFTITAELPGLTAGDVHVSAADGYVTIKGEKKEEASEKRDNFYRRERSYGSFQRVIALPSSAEFEKVDATFRNGLLTLTLPKKTDGTVEPREISIREVA